MGQNDAISSHLCLQGGREGARWGPQTDSILLVITRNLSSDAALLATIYSKASPTNAQHHPKIRLAALSDRLRRRTAPKPASQHTTPVCTWKITNWVPQCRAHAVSEISHLLWSFYIPTPLLHLHWTVFWESEEGSRQAVRSPTTRYKPLREKQQEHSKGRLEQSHSKAPSCSLLCGHMRAGMFQTAQFGTQSCKGLSNWETTFPQGMGSLSCCSTASVQTRYLEGIRKISYVISSLLLERRQKKQKKTKQSTPWDP